MNNIKFEDVFSYYTLKDSFSQCKINTNWKDSVILFDAFSDYKIREILDKLYDNTFFFDPLFHTKIYERGKERLICSLSIKDRIVQKCLNQNYILPMFRPKLIYDNCASLKGKGVDFALRRLKAHLQKAYNLYGNNFYIAKLDIKSYFDSIPHNYIFNIFERHTSDYRLLDMIAKILYQYQIDSWIHNGENVPFGIGLGGEVPQSMGILCLDELDHMFKEYYQIPYMVRYMDDIILIHQDYNYLSSVIYGASNYLNSLNMRFNENKTTILHSSQGVLFLKFHFYLGENNREIYIKPYKKSIKREKRKLNKMSELYRNGEIESWKDVLQSYYSYRGHINRGNSYNEVNILDQLIENLTPDQHDFEDIMIQRIEKNFSKESTL